MMAVSTSDIAMLTKLVGAFENSGDAYSGVSGNFDGMGISCGVLQWNIGSGSLQPLVKSIGQAAVLAAMPTLGAAMWAACNASIASGLATVRSWQNGNTLRAAAKRELQQLMGSAPMHAAQDKRIQQVADDADGWAADWASARGGGARTRQELAWFFDIATQNGNMKSIGFADVQTFKHSAAPDKIDDLVCDWMAGLGTNFANSKECHANAAQWRNAEGNIDLLVLSYLRVQKSVLKWRGDAMNRKGTIAMRKGSVHGTSYDFTPLF
jgi:hypothetical protein